MPVTPELGLTHQLQVTVVGSPTVLTVKVTGWPTTMLPVDTPMLPQVGKEGQLHCACTRLAKPSTNINMPISKRLFLNVNDRFITKNLN